VQVNADDDFDTPSPRTVSRVLDAIDVLTGEGVPA
jgi:hypothetical protein